MRVRAKVVPNQKYSGYYNHKRRVAGEIFDLVPLARINKEGKRIVFTPEQQLESTKWFERVDKVPEESKLIDQPDPEVLGDDVI
jgi:hypothetical protein